MPSLLHKAKRRVASNYCRKAARCLKLADRRRRESDTQKCR